MTPQGQYPTLDQVLFVLMLTGAAIAVLILFLALLGVFG